MLSSPASLSSLRCHDLLPLHQMALCLCIVPVITVIVMLYVIINSFIIVIVMITIIVIMDHHPSCDSSSSSGGPIYQASLPKDVWHVQRRVFCRCAVWNSVHVGH